MSILLKDATIVRQNSTRDIVHGDVYIEDDIITEVGTVHHEADIVIKDRLVMPGLMNMHTHLPMTLLRGYGDDLPLEEWLRTRIWPVEKKLKERHIRIGTTLAFMEMVAGGTTCAADMYFFEDVIAGVCRDMGMRCLAGFSIIDFDTPEMKREELIPACEKFIRKWQNDDLVIPVVAPHSTYSCSPETLERAAGMAKRYNTYIHTHCSETRHEVYDVLNRYGERPLAQLKKHGALTEKTMLAHCGWITKEEVRDIAGVGACVIHNPVSNMKLATGGYTPLPELFDAHASVTLGTDGAASNNTLDMFETMKFAALIHKHHRWDASIVTAQQVLDMATVNAARFLGLPVGSIEEGKKADVICLDLHAPNLLPKHNIVSHLVYATSGYNVTDVIINGKMVYHNRTFVTVDEDQVYEEVEKAKEELTGM